MTGELLAKHRVAARIGMTVGELVGRISYREFVDWIQFLIWEEEREMTRTTKQDWYLAQIAAEVLRPNAREPRKVTTEKMLIRFIPAGVKNRMQTSKAAWFSALGLSESELN